MKPSSFVPVIALIQTNEISFSTLADAPMHFAHAIKCIKRQIGKLWSFTGA